MSLDLDILGFVAGGLVIGIAFIAQYLGQTVLQVSPGISECSLDFHFVHFSSFFFFKTIVVLDYVEYIWNGGRTFAWSIHIRNIFSIYQCSSKYGLPIAPNTMRKQIYFRINGNIFKGLSI